MYNGKMEDGEKKKRKEVLRNGVPVETAGRQGDREKA